VTVDPRRRVPPTNDVLADPRIALALARWARPVVIDAVRAAQDAVRAGEAEPDGIVDDVVARLPRRPTSMRPVINATGVVVHTNLGRAPLSAAAMEAVATAAGYVDVELDLATGRRRPRGVGALGALRRALPDAGDVAVVNNGAAALLLAVTGLAAGREVVWGRGELVEIGDGFRLPDLVATTGAVIREVGTTNRTTAADYAAAVGPRTGCVLKVHPSNFRVEGFASEASTAELADLGVPLVVDVGSGLLHPDGTLPGEPDVVTASGDKLLGGPQVGLLAGDATIIAALRRHPLARALRVDKLALAALEGTLVGPAPPVTEAIHADPDDLRRRSDRLAACVGGEVVPSDGAVGGGGAPGLTLPGWAVAVPASWAAPLRLGEPPVLARVAHDRCLLDLRCVAPADDDELTRAVLGCR
jgi:L-seryl-tRNA(Ser) seleniumtransferase